MIKEVPENLGRYRESIQDYITKTHKHIARNLMGWKEDSLILVQAKLIPTLSTINPNFQGQRFFPSLSSIKICLNLPETWPNKDLSHDFPAILYVTLEAGAFILQSLISIAKVDLRNYICNANLARRKQSSDDRPT